MFDQRNIQEAGLGAQVLTEFVEDESVVPASPTGTEVLKLQISNALAYRRLYYYMEVAILVAAADYLVEGELVFLKSGRPVAILPANIGQDKVGTLANSKSSIATGATDPGPDAIRVCLSKAFTGGNDNVNLNPTRIFAFADEVVWRAKGVSSNVTSLRVYVAVLSTNREV